MVGAKICGVPTVFEKALNLVVRVEPRGSLTFRGLWTQRQEHTHHDQHQAPRDGAHFGGDQQKTAARNVKSPRILARIRNCLLRLDESHHSCGHTATAHISRLRDRGGVRLINYHSLSSAASHERFGRLSPSVLTQPWAGPPQRRRRHLRRPPVPATRGGERRSANAKRRRNTNARANPSRRNGESVTRSSTRTIQKGKEMDQDRPKHALLECYFMQWVPTALEASRRRANTNLAIALLTATTTCAPTGLRRNV